MKKFLRGLGLVLFLLLLGSKVWADGWYITTVDTTPYSGVYGTSLTLDSLGNPHIAYARYAGPGGLMYASWDPENSTWILESVFDSTGKGGKIAGILPSLALDSKGYPHISFCWGDLGYAWKDSTGWHTTHPYPGPWIGYTSIRLDRNDYPHIGYGAWIGEYLSVILHTYWDGYNWYTEVIDTVDYSPSFGDGSLVLDSSDCPHLTYNDQPPPQLKYAKRIDGIWHIETVDSPPGEGACGGMSSIVIDSLGRPCIAYGHVLGYNLAELKYAVRHDTGWCTEKVDTIGRAGYANSLCIDRYNNPHIAYEANGWLKHAWKDTNGLWYIEKIDSIFHPRIGKHEGTYFTIVIDESDQAHISYNEELVEMQGTVRYARGYALTTGIGVISTDKPSTVTLEIYPNIACAEVKITYILEKRDNVNITIYNILGQKVANLVNEKKAYGKHVAYWATKNVSNGIYFCCLKTAGTTITKKFVVIK